MGYGSRARLVTARAGPSRSRPQLYEGVPECHLAGLLAMVSTAGPFQADLAREGDGQVIALERLSVRLEA